MRLSCPNCDAEYDIPDGMVPAAGRHVQCTACHTRWFARGAAAAAPTEDQIVHRLETRPAHAEPDAVTESPQPPVASVPPAPVVPLRPAGPAKPSDRPLAARPAVVSAARVSPRLDLDPEVSPPPAVQPPPPSRFGLGLALPLLLFLAALGTYHFRAELAVRLPVATSALAAYGDSFERLRARIEDRLVPVRDYVARLAG